MTVIDFSKYPRIDKYVSHLKGEYAFKPFEYSLLTEESFVNIVHQWIDQYEKNIDIYVNNSMELFELTSESTGHQALSVDWSRWRGQKKRIITEEKIRKYWNDSFVACIAHLYQNHTYKKDIETRGGAGSCGISCGFTIRFIDSDIKNVNAIAICSFNMSYSIVHSNHIEVDVYDK